MLKELGFISFGSVETVKRRFGLSNNDTGKIEDIRTALINANDFIKTYLTTHGFCRLPKCCSLGLDKIAMNLALSDLYLDTTSFGDTDYTSSKSKLYKDLAIEDLDLFIVANKNECTDLTDKYGVTIANKKRECINTKLKHNIYR